MYYSTIGVLAILTLLIENHDILLNNSEGMKQPVWRVYRRFLIAILVYYISDVLWGGIEHLKLAKILFADTTFYFIAMACSVLFWTQFAVTYLNENSTYGRILIYIGRIFCAALMIAVTINFFTPILFSVDTNSVYTAKPFRHIMLIVQIIVLDLVTIYALIVIICEKGKIKKRYRTIALFGLIMATFLTIQIWFPYLPLYTVAYFLGTCLLHTFVVNDEKDEIRSELAKAVEREKKQYEELLNTRMLAYKDALTGVRSKRAYAEYETQKDMDIKTSCNPNFAVAVFDLNGLKEINDTLGHNKGDQFIIEGCTKICNHFKHSPVFRIGGDEFVVLLENEDFENREELTKSFHYMMDHSSSENAVIAMGISDYIAGQDESLHDIFVRADKLMYERKREMKKGKT